MSHLRVSAGEERLKIYDPKRGQSFHFDAYKNHGPVSSAAYDMLVVEVSPALELLSDPNSKIISAALNNFDLMHGAGFVCTYAAPKSIESHLPENTVRKGQGCFGQFPLSRDAINQCISWLREMRFGEFTFGSLQKPFKDSFDAKSGASAKDFDLLFVASMMTDINWFISFYADTGSALIVTKPGLQTEAFLAEISSLN